VWREGPEPPWLWGRVLARRVAADSLFDLETIHRGFMRPSTGEDWALAYYQAELYVRYMAERYGAGAPVKMLAAYADQLDTPAALEKCFGVTQKSFEESYRDYVRSIARVTGAHRTRVGFGTDHATLERVAASNPRDADVLARLARACLQDNRLGEAKEWAGRALALDPREQLAASVMAQVHLSQRDTSRAMDLLRGVLDPDDPGFEALVLRTNLVLAAKDYVEVERLALLGEQHFPFDVDWLGGLTYAYRETGQRDKLTLLLSRRAEGHADDVNIRMELARLAVGREDAEAAGRWALEAIHIDVLNAEAHAILASSLAQRGRHDHSVEEYGAAAKLRPEKLDWRLAQAKQCAAAGSPARAREILEELLEQNPQLSEARALLRSLRD